MVASDSHPAVREPGSTRAGEPQANANTRWRTALVVSILTIEVLLWVGVFGVGRAFRDGPNGKSMGTDFAVFSAAANALKHGQNPYDYRVLYRSEKALLGAQHLTVTSNEFNVRAGNPPIFYWALEPLTSLPFQRIAWVWIGAMYLSSALGFALALRYLKWTTWFVPALIFLLMPQVVTGAVYGNVHGPIFASLALCLLLVRRHPSAAGAVATFGWLKPQLALPLVLLIFLFHSTERRRMATGFLVASVALFSATVLAIGWQSFGQWIAGLNSWSKGISKEPNIASLSGLYVPWASRPLQLAIASAVALLALVVTALAWRMYASRLPLPIRTVGWLWAVWFLASPFTHFPDEVVLTIPVLAILGRNAAYLSSLPGAATLYLALFSLVLFPTPLVAVTVMALAALLVVAARSPHPTSAGSHPLTA